MFIGLDRLIVSPLLLITVVIDICTKVSQRLRFCLIDNMYSFQDTIFIQNTNTCKIVSYTFNLNIEIDSQIPLLQYSLLEKCLDLSRSP